MIYFFLPRHVLWSGELLPAYLTGIFIVVLLGPEIGTRKVFREEIPASKPGKRSVSPMNFEVGRELGVFHEPLAADLALEDLDVLL